MSSCSQDCALIDGQNVWVLSKNRFLDQSSIDSISEGLNKNNIPSENLLRTIQDCNFDAGF